MEKILVTGAAGFVAKNLIPLLFANDCLKELVLVDKHAINPTLINALYSKSIQFRIHTGNTLPTDSSIQDVDALICLAGATSVDAALLEPKKAIDENIAIALDIAEWSHHVNSTAKIIYMSSDEVLGESVDPLDEEAPLNPTQPYAVSKASAEMILHNYRDIYGLNIVTLRSCNLVGPGQQMPKLIPTTVHSLLENYPVPIHGTGKQLREWMYVEDLCRAIILLLEQDVKPQVFQATSGVKISVNDVVRKVADTLCVDLQSKNVADRRVQDKSYAMKTTRLRSIGWQPVFSPQEAITRSAKSLAQQMDY